MLVLVSFLWLKYPTFFISFVTMLKIRFKKPCERTRVTSLPSPCARTLGSIYSGRRPWDHAKNFCNKDVDSGTNKGILILC